MIAVKPTMTKSLSLGSLAYGRLIGALARQMPTGHALRMVNEVLVRNGQTPESLADDEVANVIAELRDELERSCAPGAMDELSLDLSAFGYALRPSRVG